MYTIKISNCNNIKDGTIEIEKGKLNIKYGINGTGKTTIAKSIYFHDSNDELQNLKSFFSDEAPSVEITPELKTVLVFNEDFVNQFVFLEEDIIQNSFEVFLKTPKYDEQKEKLDRRLETLHQIFMDNQEITTLKSLLQSISSKFTLTERGGIKKSGVYKSLLSKQNLYNIPVELDGYKPFISNTDINIAWIEWKNKGDDYDISGCCPYCTEKINRDDHNKRKAVFQNTYKKTDSKNLKDILDLFLELKNFIKEDKYKELISYIKSDTDEQLIECIVGKLICEIRLIISRLDAIESFGRKRRFLADISELENYVKGMRLPAEFDIFGGLQIESIIANINDKVGELLKEIKVLKSELGTLKSIMNATIKASQKDINEFLNTAGINYELHINVDEYDENQSKTILQQCYSGDKTEVKNVRNHLSWGEKNAFSLVLFMYYAYTQNPDLIILDDPISSFDSNKKYAIMHRLFKNIGRREVSFENKTVLLLTHDFEPITDFLVVGKLDEHKATASYIWNENKVVQEQIIDINNDIKLITDSYIDLSTDPSLNIVSRIAFLRKLCEVNACKEDWGYSYEILSCLIHGSELRKKVGNRLYEMIPQNEIDKGINHIRIYIPDFEFEFLKNNVYSISHLKKLYLDERNSYFKIQIFRAMRELEKTNEIEISKLDSAWYKFIDESYHIENDLLHFLDLKKFNIVPEYILDKVNSIMDRL
jgi:hypothetical protein